MNLSIVYENNNTAEKIAELAAENWDNVSSRKITITDIEHLIIDIPAPQGYSRRLVNTPKAIKNCLVDEDFYTMMTVNSIPNGPRGEEGIIRSYQVLVCDLEVLSIKLQSHNKAAAKPKYIKEIENTKVAEMARRVISLTGLDLGMVNIDFTARRRLKVVNVEPSPEVRDKDLIEIINRLNYMYDLDETIKNREVKLGADPEFMLSNVKTGKMVSASQFFPRDGMIGCDNIRVPNRQQRPVAEVRPSPSNNPLVLTENIKLALDRAYRLAPYRNLKWLAGSQPFAGYSIGGHIHFSNIKLDAALMRALDNYVAVPVFLLEDPRTAVRRRKRYGLLSEYRIKSYGGFEYRTPGSWLVSREITAAVLCLAKIVVTNYPYLDKNFINDALAQQAFYQGNHEYFKPLFPEIWSDVQKTSMYDEYSEVLNAIPRMIASGEYWDEKHDIRKVWKISSGGKKDYVANFRPDNDESQDANYDNPGFEHISAEPLNNRSDAQIRRRPAANNNMGDYDYIPRTSVNRSVHVNAGSNNNGRSSLSTGNVSVSSPARRTRINM